MLIQSFKCEETAKWFNDESSREFPADIQRVARRKLLQINASCNINDLRTPPGNHLEKLNGNRKGQHSIKINDKYRICFIWKDNDAYKVEIVDYH
jgi:proteic killer suppression protein